MFNNRSIHLVLLDFKPRCQGHKICILLRCVMSNMVQISLRSSLDGEMSWPNPCTTTLSRAPIQSVPQCYGTGCLFALPQKICLIWICLQASFCGLASMWDLVVLKPCLKGTLVVFTPNWRPWMLHRTNIISAYNTIICILVSNSIL